MASKSKASGTAISAVPVTIRSSCSTNSVISNVIADWTLTSLREKLIKIGAKVVSHGRYVTFQMAEVAIPRAVFAELLQQIAALRLRSAPAPT